MTTKEGTWHGDTMAIKSLLPHPSIFEKEGLKW